MQDLSKLGIMAILHDWNYWDRDFPTVIPRPEYQEKMQRLRRSDEIIVLTGMRRSGKSTLLKQEMEDLARDHNKTQLLYINFEDPRFPPAMDSSILDQILATYRENINPDKEVYLFLDEVQNVQSWEKWVVTAYELQKARIYLTGSSSTLLSGEIASSISGRYLKIDVYPLTFQEYLLFHDISCTSINEYTTNRTMINRLFTGYLTWGGFPKVTMLEEDLKKEELLSYFHTILLRDIMGRYKLRNYDILLKLVEYLLTNDTKQNNIHSISKALAISYETTHDYIDYLKQVYFFFEVRNFHYSLKKQLVSDIKFYALDTGFVNSVAFSFSENIGRLYENVVCNALIRKGRQIFFFRDATYECDFVVKEGTRVTKAIQVCYHLTDQNLKREIGGLVSACKAFDLDTGYIITEQADRIMEEDGVEIRIVPIVEYLLKIPCYNQ